MQFDTASQNNRSQYIPNMDVSKIQSALQSLKEERAHIEEYLQNAAAKKKELDSKLKSPYQHI